jgi:transposase
MWLPAVVHIEGGMTHRQAAKALRVSEDTIRGT